MRNRRYIGVMAALIFIIILTTAFTINGNGEDSFTFRGDLMVREGEVLDGNAVVIFGDAVIDGNVKGELAVIFGDVIVNGEVGGNVAAVFGSVKVGEKGVINGSVAAVMGEVKKELGAIIHGEIASVKGPFKSSGIRLIPAVSIFSVISLIIFYGISSLLLILMPDRMSFMVAGAQQNMGRRFGIGLVAYILFIPAIVALAISIIGLLVIPLFIPAFLLTAFIGVTALKVAIGKRISGDIEGKGADYIYLLIGAVLIFVLPYIPVLGWLAYLGISCIGLGLVLDTRFGKPKINL